MSARPGQHANAHQHADANQHTGANEYAVALPDPRVPPAPTDLSAVYNEDLKSGYVTLSWSPFQPPEGTTFNVYRNDQQPVPVDGAHRIASGLTTGFYSDENGQLGDYYVVTAVSFYGDESEPSNTAMATDGSTTMSFEQSEPTFLIAFDLDGNRLWVQQFGTLEWDQGGGVVVGPQGDIYVTCFTAGDFAAELRGDKDIFVARFSAEGEQLGANHVGSEFNDKGAGLAFDADGNLFVAGFSNGDLAGQQGKFDVVLVQYDVGLQQRELRQFGSAADDAADAWAERNLFITTGGGDVVLSGLTMGRMNGHLQRGSGDVFLMRIHGGP